MTEHTFAPRETKAAVEEGTGFAPKFDAAGLIPCVTTDAATGELLMFAYMNAEALAQTIRLGEAVYWSRSRGELWHKGATSGHTQVVSKILTDCDQDALVLKVHQHGPGCCHAGYRSCFYRNIQNPGAPVALEQEIAEQSYDPNRVYG